jgi:signal peptidase I
MPDALVVRCLCRVYLVMLYTYPRPFRQRFGGEMRQVFRDRCREVARAHGFARWIRFAYQSAVDGLGTACEERAASLSPRGFGSAAVRHARAVWTAGTQQVPHSTLAEWAFTLLGFLFITTTMMQAYVVPTGSMESTVLIGDHMLVDRVTYAQPGIFSRLLPYRDVQRGDIVVILFPEDESQTYVKRVIGLPGDHIRLENKQVIRNGHRLIEPYTQHIDPMLDTYRDDFPTSPQSLTTPRGRAMFRDNVRDGELIVPPGTIFAMGDNRDNSSDSRYWGLVPRANVVGKPLLVYWSFDAPTKDLESWNVEHLADVVLHFFSKTRWERTFLVPRAQRAQEQGLNQ